MWRWSEKNGDRKWLVIILFSLILASTVSGQEAVEEEVSTENETVIRSHEIPLPKLEYFVHEEEGKEALRIKYHSIPDGQRKPWIVAALPENIAKNRYDDLLAYDETRVVLDPLPDDPFSDYINANYIDGYHRDREYVATQGPLPNTVNDFWRMIWQLNSRKIVMLANVVEHGKIKVEKYWPETNSTYGDIVVCKLSENTSEKHTIRSFSVRKLGNSSMRIVKQFHYTGWPDMGVPEDRLSVVSLIQQAKRFRPYDTFPLVVHCSAGVGRTGTVILMDSMLEKAKAEERVDFLKRLDHMRNQRVSVVEKEAQYIFAHEALYDTLMGNSSDYLQRMQNQHNEAEGTYYDSNNNEVTEEFISSPSDEISER